MAERRGKDPEVINGMLDRLSHRMSYQEEAEFRRAAMDRRSPTHLRDLHDHVAGLLVKHGIATWNQLHGSSHGERSCHRLGWGGGRWLFHHGICVHDIDHSCDLGFSPVFYSGEWGWQGIRSVSQSRTSSVWHD